MKQMSHRSKIRSLRTRIKDLEDQTTYNDRYLGVSLFIGLMSLLWEVNGTERRLSKMIKYESEAGRKHRAVTAFIAAKLIEKKIFTEQELKDLNELEYTSAIPYRDMLSVRDES